MRVDVYRNLRANKYSIRHKGKVIAHASNVTISQPEFVVSSAGRERVRREGRKNVHAFVRGELIGVNEETILDVTPNISYNPYTHETFQRNGKPIFTSEGYAVLRDDFKIEIGRAHV